MIKISRNMQKQRLHEEEEAFTKTAVFLRDIQTNKAPESSRSRSFKVSCKARERERNEDFYLITVC